MLDRVLGVNTDGAIVDVLVSILTRRDDRVLGFAMRLASAGRMRFNPHPAR